MASKTYKIGNMDCANCARELETGVRKLDGVENVRVDFMSGKMVLEGNVEQDVLKKRVEALGKTLITTDAPKIQRNHKPDHDDHGHGHSHDHGHEHTPITRNAAPPKGAIRGFWDYLVARHETRLALIGGGLILLTLFASLAFPIDTTITSVLYIVAMMIALYPIAKNGLNTLWINRTFNINLLMTIAAVGAIIIGEYLEGATVIFLFAIGEALEGYTADRARDSLRSLMSLAPPVALRVRGDLEETVAVEELAIGDTILVKPGERIPIDGVVISGNSGVNQAPITGESIPVFKGPDDKLYAASINGEGLLTVRVTHLSDDTSLSRIIRLVEEAESVRAPSQRMIDQFAHYYTPGVVVVALLVAFLPPLLFNAPFYDVGETRGWLYRALTMLVIACPCALVISTPVTVISAITRAARRGVLIKGGAYLEALGNVKAIAFDKTGTLTSGNPVVTEVYSLECAEKDNPCEHCDDILALASAVEQRSTHPLARAIVSAAEARQLEQVYAPAQTVEMLAGRGVQGEINDKWVTVGSHVLFDSEYPHDQALCERVDAAEARGQSTMLINDGERVRGYIAVADTPREDSKAVIQSLHELGVKTAMLTGDNARAAEAIAKELGVTDVRAGLMPEDKATAVQGLMDLYKSVAIIGDGVNDTPAMATATIGIAMGGAGSAQALETADIALMGDDLKQVPFALRLSRFAQSLIRQNVVLSLGMKLLFLGLAFFGEASLWMAILADVGMSLVVTLNGMRPLRYE